MAIDIIVWAGAINLVLFIRVLWRLPENMRMTAESQLLREQTMAVCAQIEQEKLAKGITEADFHREKVRAHEAVAQLNLFKRLTGQEPTC